MFVHSCTVRAYIHMYVCTVRTYICMYIRTYVCMYIRTYMCMLHIHTYGYSESKSICT